ncbi:MAG: sigma-70 family RNA polymerase sigma factor [Bacteroidales bacterium]|nr:sigma-70 family RNA polymerase sigma factor [Bacteroidales bacterium]
MTAREFKDLFLPLQSAMQLLAERILSDADEAEDVVQEVMLMLWEQRERVGGFENARGYAMQCTRARSIDHLRRRNRQEAYSAAMRLETDEAIVMDVEERDANSALLHRMLETLPDKQRRAVEMKYLEECSTEEMEQELAMSAGAVYTTLSRAMKTLKERLSKHTII